MSPSTMANRCPLPMVITKLCILFSKPSAFHRTPYCAVSGPKPSVSGREWSTRSTRVGGKPSREICVLTVYGHSGERKYIATPVKFKVAVAFGVCVSMCANPKSSELFADLNHAPPG